MFKQGICVNYRQEGVFSAVKAAGADYVELNFADVGSASPEKVRELRDELSALGLPCLGYNGMFPWNGMKVTGPKKDYVLIDEYLASHAENIRGLGSKFVVFGSHGARRVDGDDNTLENAFEELVVLLRDHVAPVFRREGLVCAVEPLSVDTLVHTVADGARLVELVNQPEIRLLADTFHMYRNGEDLSEMEKYGRLLSHIHVGEGVHRNYPKVGDGVDYSRIFDILRRVNYQGAVSVESDLNGCDFAQVAKESMDCFRLAQG